jgi:heme-degrading monooxygenase HmoA
LEHGLAHISQQEVVMHARVTRSRVALDAVDEAVGIVESSILPAAKEQPGFQGYVHLVDHATGEGISITLWATEADMRAGETGPYYQEQIDKVRSLLATEPEVGSYDVVVYDLGG